MPSPRRAGSATAAILLVGDAPYYARFGFSAEKTGSLAMPGPYERHRLLALELEEGALDGAHGRDRGVPAASSMRQTFARPASREARRLVVSAVFFRAGRR